MCKCHADFTEADRRGDLARAVELGALPCPDKQRCSSAVMVDWLNQFAFRFPLSRALRGQPTLKAHVLRWYLTAREEIPDAVEQFWRPAGEVGAARFCVAHPSTHEGQVLTLRVLEEGTELTPGTLLLGMDRASHELAPRIDESFREAVEWSRKFFVDQFTHVPAATRVRRAVVLLDHASERLTGPSVGLAALVAFSSLALRLPVRPDQVFTGVPVPERRDYGPVNPSTLPGKARAVQRLGPAARLVCPPGSTLGLQDLELRSVLADKDWRRAVCEALGLPDYQRIEDELRQPVPSVSTSSRAYEEVMQDAVRCCLQAAEEIGLDLYQLELCFDLLRRQDQRLGAFSTSSLTRELEQLRVASQASERQGRWRWQGPPEAALSLGHERARRALVEVWEQQGWLGHAARLLTTLRDHAAAARLLDPPLSSPTPAASVMPFLARLFPLLEHGWSSTEFAAQLDQVFDRLQRLPRQLLKVALRCGRLPGPFASLARSWSRCLTLTDLLLWLQSATELTLHTLVALHPPHPPAAIFDEWSHHWRRPSIGILARLVHRHVPGANQLLPRLQDADALAGPWNEVLHARGAWAALGEITPELLDDLSVRLIPLLSLIPERENDLLLALRPEHVQSVEGGWLYRRGEGQGQERFWSYDRMAVAFRPVGVTNPPEPLRLTRFARASAPPNPPINFLPTPVAKALLDLRQAATADQRFFHLDDATRWLLELALPEASALRQAEKASGWGRSVHKRAILDAILHVPADLSPSWAGHYLQAPAARVAATELISLLERMEHGAPPLADWVPWLDEASTLLTDWLQLSPWTQPERHFEILGRLPNEDGTLQFAGKRPRPRREGAVPPSEGVWLFHHQGALQLLSRLELRGTSGEYALHMKG